MQLADFDYELPDDLIARFPAPERRASRLLVVDPARDALRDSRFSALPSLLDENDLLVFNDTRVIKARLFGQKDTGGRVEVLLERVEDERNALAHVRASKSPKPGTVLQLPGGCHAEVSSRDGELFRLRFDRPLGPYLEEHGSVPLPPYLQRDAAPEDAERYQTVYAREPGAVAAPTAGLHFDDAMLAETAARGIRHAWVTLHVGAGTFQNLRPEQLASNRLHSERVVVDEAACEAVTETRRRGGRVVAVGTTSVRALEMAAAGGTLQPFAGETELFIRPGYAFRAVDAMLTNFHLPQSSLLMLVSAFAGRDRMLAAYRHAVAGRYRFFSYGDAMLILSREPTS